MMKFVAVLLVAAVFAVSVVDGRHHGLVKRDANCAVSVVDLVDGFLSDVLIYANDSKSELFDTLTNVVTLAIAMLWSDVGLIRNTCIDSLIAQIEQLPTVVIKSGDLCITNVIEQARIALHAVLDPLKDNQEVLCYLQECFGTGIVNCIAQLGQVVDGKLPVVGRLVFVIALIFPILTKLLAATTACVANITTDLNNKLDKLKANVLACPRGGII